MKKVTVFLIVVIAVLGLLSLHTGPTSDGRPQVIMDVTDPSLEGFAAAWENEVGRRFPNSVVLLCHGGEAVQGDWLVLPYGGPGGCWTIEHAIAVEQAKYPGRTLVILSCNPRHETLHGFPNVYYAKSSVWCVPDRTVIDSAATQERFTLDGRSDHDPDDVGNVYELVEAR